MTGPEEPSTHSAASSEVVGGDALPKTEGLAGARGQEPAGARAEGDVPPVRESEWRRSRQLRDLTPAKRRRLVAVGLLKALATTVVLVLLYYVLPFNHRADAASVVLLVVGTLGVVLIVGWEVRVILQADYPEIQAVEALAMIGPLFLLLFASAYYLVGRATPTSFSERLSRTGALYFTVTTFSTVGYGDITPKTDGTRIMVMFQMLTDLAILGFVVKVILGAVQMGLQRPPAGPTEDSAGSPWRGVVESGPAPDRDQR